jgi:hypothetical protein
VFLLYQHALRLGYFYAGYAVCNTRPLQTDAISILGTVGRLRTGGPSDCYSNPGRSKDFLYCTWGPSCFPRSSHSATSFIKYRNEVGGSTMLQPEGRWFDSPSPSNRTGALMSTQPLREMSTRNPQQSKGRHTFKSIVSIFTEQPR